MLQGINILAFFQDKDSRHWESSTVKENLVSFKNNIFPPMVFVLDTNETTGSLKLINESTQVEEESVSLTFTTSGDKKIIHYIGSIIDELPDGKYSLKLIIGNNVSVYYSEVFAMLANTDELIGINIVSSDVTMNMEHTIPMGLINPKFFLPYTGYAISIENTDDGVEKYYGDMPAFSATNFIIKLEIIGTDQIFRYLACMRTFSVNGVIYITLNGVTRRVYDIKIEEKDNIGFGESMLIIMSYREYDFIATKNEI